MLLRGKELAKMILWWLHRKPCQIQKLQPKVLQLHWVQHLPCLHRPRLSLRQNDLMLSIQKICQNWIRKQKHLLLLWKNQSHQGLPNLYWQIMNQNNYKRMLYFDKMFVPTITTNDFLYQWNNKMNFALFNNLRKSEQNLINLFFFWEILMNHFMNVFQITFPTIINEKGYLQVWL